MISFYNSLVESHPIFTMFIYIVFCVGVGVSIFFIFSFIRKKIEIKRNMKRRVQNDKSN